MDYEVSTESPFSGPRSTLTQRRSLNKSPFAEPAPKKSTTDTSDNSSDSTPVLDRNYKLPPPARLEMTLQPTSRLILLQQWEGFVESIDSTENTFCAILKDLEPGGNSTDETAEFSLDEIDSDDIELFRVGAVFRWIIGYRELRHGNRERVSSLYFRRRPALATSMSEEAQSRIKRYSDAFR